MVVPEPSRTVRYGSPELACYHEAGHAAAAVLAGARLIEMELYLKPTPHGRTRADRDERQRKVIALGGFAVERRLWKEGRLFLPDGRRPEEPEMLTESSFNAEIDKAAYFGGDHREQDGYWPRHMDLEFMTAARDLGDLLDLDLVERLAGALLTEKKLDQARIKEIVRPQAEAT